MKSPVVWSLAAGLLLTPGMMGCGAKTQPAVEAEAADGTATALSQKDIEAKQKAVAAQRECGQTLGLPVEFTNRFGMKFALIPPGEFLMGSPDSDSDAKDNEKPQHKVQITEPFYLGVYELTGEEYEKVILGDPNHSTIGRTGVQSVREKDMSNRPVVHVDWEQAVEFCERLTALEVQTYRLPTEAEWEYACRAATTTKWYCGDNEAELDRVAWYGKNSGTGRTHPVGMKEPNNWGLFDMHGNVSEFCHDRYADYSSGAAMDLAVPTE